jgi:peptidoglycan hydrolase-like protein with peptidoglycan-binding domain
MELLAYIQEEFVKSDEAIASESDNSASSSSSSNFESTFQAWLKKLTTKSAKLSLNVILASTTVLIGLGASLNSLAQDALAQVTPSSDVRYVQSLLAKNGFDPGAIDGVAGVSTKNAIIRAQRTLGLSPDGIAGSRTIAGLENGGSNSASAAQVKVAQASSTTLNETTAPGSSEVMNLQKLLADRGFYNGAVDGLTGAQTRNAILAAQKTYNLTADGVAGSRTLAALESNGNKASVLPVSTTSTTKNAEISNLQQLLSKRGFYNGTVDGLMGPQTRLAIVAAQKNYGLATDGIAGSQTLAALDSGSVSVNIADRNREIAAKATTEAKSTDVLALQQLLAKRGFYNGALDGIKGAQTNVAIAAAQRSYGLISDGIAGSQTMAALQKDARPSPPVTVTPTPTNNQTPKAVAAPSANDGGVANLQNLLTDRGFYKGQVTGFLGPITKEAIIAAQEAYGLPADGIAGAKTIAALEAGAPTNANSQPIKVNTVAPIITPTVTPTIKVEPKPQVAPQVPTPQAATPQPQASPKPQAAAQPTTAAQPSTTASNPQVIELQNLLAKRGFYNGKPDGALTGETRNAIVRAQNYYTISPADGSPSSKLVENLSKDTFISEGN